MIVHRLATAALALAASALALAQPQTPLGPTPQGLGGPRPVPLNMTLVSVSSATAWVPHFAALMSKSGSNVQSALLPRVVRMARTGADLKGVAAFHANLGPNVPAATPGKVKGKILVQNGADDPLIKPEEIGAFKQEMQLAKVDYRYVDYPRAVHAFTNPEATALGKKFGLPLKYDAAADKKAKAEATKFLADVLQK